ncbi:hypothetical protein RDWZM_004270 [Blomia tropicalis]|uniref:Uncharacterized protein n=1 Tax=Blomia tropicalis TaxID=40697 RepID=A0A9Q0MKV5_BLOTA|nr:hypothetical protein RDWZM_004270 [Blomia tropicalis]
MFSTDNIRIGTDSNDTIPIDWSLFNDLIVGLTRQCYRYHCGPIRIGIRCHRSCKIGQFSSIRYRSWCPMRSIHLYRLYVRSMDLSSLAMSNGSIRSIAQRIRHIDHIDNHWR